MADGAHARRRSGRRARARAAGRDAVRRVRTGRARAHLHRALRADGVHGLAPHRGNRHSHGARCDAIGRALAGRAAGVHDRAGGLGDRRSGRLGRPDGSPRGSSRRCSTRSRPPIRSRSRPPIGVLVLVAMAAGCCRRGAPRGSIRWSRFAWSEGPPSRFALRRGRLMNRGSSAPGLGTLQLEHGSPWGLPRGR